MFRGPYANHKKGLSKVIMGELCWQSACTCVCMSMWSVRRHYTLASFSKGRGCPKTAAQKRLPKKQSISPPAPNTNTVLIPHNISESVFIHEKPGFSEITETQTHKNKKHKNKTVSGVGGNTKRGNPPKSKPQPFSPIHPSSSPISRPCGAAEKWRRPRPSELSVTLAHAGICWLQ